MHITYVHADDTECRSLTKKSSIRSKPPLRLRATSTPLPYKASLSAIHPNLT